MRKLIVVLIESILAALQANFELTRAIADQVGLTGQGEVALTNAISNFGTLENDINVFKGDVNDEPAEPPAEQPQPPA